ncbi:MAG TPA: nitroreductase family protein [Prolixibacteraceae bacterium]|nr:nitroreductase family protein [Prolixibacteraceae bacterium]HPS13390.1 nitroreductase family protein [Prolixibacteraceae bacterium]
MEFTELLQNRRSKRKFTAQKVEPEKIEALIRAALMSPTGKKKNHWDFIFIEATDTLEKLSECKPHGAKLIAVAPLAVVVVGDPQQSDTWVEDCSIASVILQLQSEALELGSCWVQVLHREHDETTTADAYIKTLLGIPEKKAVLSVIAIGYPDEVKKPFDLSTLMREKIHREMF